LLKSYQGCIDITLKGGADEYRIEVTDNGCGLPKGHRNHLLDPYMTTRKKGTGLGLAIVQRIAEQHGGRISLKDAPRTKKNQNGARISLVFPYRKKLRSKEKNSIADNLRKDAEKHAESGQESIFEGESDRV